MCCWQRGSEVNKRKDARWRRKLQDNVIWAWRHR